MMMADKSLRSIAPLTVLLWKILRALLNSVQKFIKKQGWLLHFHMFTQSIKSSFNSIIVQMSEKRDSSNRQ